ncbi:MAG: hypothetical protein GQ583_02495 [Methyloprofundus sp.]|nr:hypothetical protein [Methyloprofundus sp.]
MDGLTAVPIHITQVDASIIFNASSKTTEVIAEMQFEVGPDSGYPYFDLQQTITGALLDNAFISVADIEHHYFGGGSNTDLRVIEQWLVSGSIHTLTLTYSIEEPMSPNGQPPSWESGSTRLWFNILLSDLNPARYLESWIPSNLLFDMFPVNLDIQITNSNHSHVLLSNGIITGLENNHWKIDFPDTFASCSPLIIIGATDRVEQLTTDINLTGGVVLSLELLKRSSDVNLNLATAANILLTYLDDNHTSIGAYMHGNRYTAYLSSSSIHSMEYNGGTTSSMSALKHEVFHSWWARGMTPAYGDDGWLDEGWTSFNANGPIETAFDMSDVPVTLWYNNPFIRKTPNSLSNSSYTHGAGFFAGLASELGLSTLLSHMSGIYKDRLEQRYTTPEIEAELIRRSGKLELARYFDRFVYGFGNLPANTAPDVYLRDALNDNGTVPYNGVFWRSPDVWVRNADDGGSSHQNPESGQDNWFYARVHNRGNATARSFAVGFKIKTWAGTQFVYPDDWFPLTGATVGFNLEPGESKIVKARWPKEDIPPIGTHGCLLAVVYNSDDSSSDGAYIWEHNNLAQRNMSVVDLIADESILLPLWIGSQYSRDIQFHTLELLRPKQWLQLQVAITHKKSWVVKDIFRSYEKLKPSINFPERKAILELKAPPEIPLYGETVILQATKGSKLIIKSKKAQCLSRVPMQADLIKCGRSKNYLIRYELGRKVAFPIALRKAERRNVYLQLTAPKGAKAGTSMIIDIVQCDARGRVVGGISAQINIKNGKGKKS